MYAIIKFTDEDKTRIVSVKDIKHFDIKTLNLKKKYLVRYEEDHFPAQIVMVKDSIEELEHYQKTKRISVLNKALLESASETCSESDYPVAEKQKRKKEKAVHPLKGKRDDSSLESSFLTQYKDLQSTEANKTDEKTVEDDTQNNLKKTIKNLKTKLEECNGKIEDLSLQNKELTDLNIQLQKTVIDSFEKFCNEVNKYKTPGEGNIVAAQANGQVHLGRDVYISKTAFDDIWARATSGPQFVKNIALAVFGTTTLLISSVTGKKSNRIKKEVTKPALDGTKLAAIEDIYKYYLKEKEPSRDAEKEIKSVRTYIRNKISDLIKTANRHTKDEVVDAEKESTIRPAIQADEIVVDEEDVDEEDDVEESDEDLEN